MKNRKGREDDKVHRNEDNTRKLKRKGKEEWK
jgi:hypothetical protein